MARPPLDLVEGSRGRRLERRFRADRAPARLAPRGDARHHGNAVRPNVRSGAKIRNSGGFAPKCRGNRVGVPAVMLVSHHDRTLGPALTSLDHRLVHVSPIIQNRGLDADGDQRRE
jgi:hypothetical protein